MSQNQCEHIRPDGARCQAPLQTGRSFCFFHDPEQQEKRAAARRNGGFMRDQASRTPNPSLLPENVPYIAVQTRDEIAYALQMIVCWLLLGQIDPKVANVLIFALSVASANLAAKERLEREAARAAERAAQRAAREACTKEAIERAVERAVQQALAKAAGKAVEASPPAEPEKPEEPVIIDASQPWDLSQFGGKKPRISCVVPVFTSMRTGKIIDVNEPNPLDPPEHMLRDEFRRKPQSPTPAAPSAGPQAAPPEHTPREEFPRSTVPGTKNIPCFVPRREPNASDHSEGLREGVRNQESSAVGAAEVVGHGFSHDGAKRTEARQRWESRTEDQHRSAEACPVQPWGPRGSRPFSDKDGARDFGEEKGGGSATDKTAEPEPKDAKPKKDPNNPYSITTLLPDPPRPFESKPETRARIRQRHRRRPNPSPARGSIPSSNTGAFINNDGNTTRVPERRGLKAPRGL